MPPRHENLQKLHSLLLNKSMTIQGIASHFNINIRTAYRYIQSLQKESSMFVKATDSLGETLYRIETEEIPTIPSQMNKDINSLLETLQQQGLTDVAGLIENLVIQLNQPKNSAQKELLKKHRFFHLDQGPFAESKTLSSKTKHQKILDAIQKRNTLKITYRKEEKQEHIEICPLRYVLKMGRLYLIAYNIQTPENIHPYADNRIRNISSTSNKFTVESNFDPNEFYKHCFGQYVPNRNWHKPIEIKLRTKEDWVKALFRESSFEPPARLNNEGDYLNITLNLYNTPDLQAWIVSWMPDLQVLSPKTFIDEIKKKLTTSLTSLDYK